MDPQQLYRLLVSCPDQRGIIAATCRLLADHGANVVDLDQHTDPDDGVFFMRLEFDAHRLGCPFDKLNSRWSELASTYAMRWRLARAGHRKRIAIAVSKQTHCLADLLFRASAGELEGDLALVLSNHPDARSMVETAGVPFHVLPVTPETKSQQEQHMLELLAESRIDLLVLARYMQILSERVVDAMPDGIINIHHSFLPAFKGARPYHQAHAKGVKLIGATAHYVTTDLDQGPIIAQQTAHVTHRDTVEELTRKGRDLERTTLASAVRAHLADRVLTHQGRTIVFE